MTAVQRPVPGRGPYRLGRRIGLVAGPIVFLLVLLVDPPAGLSLNAWRTAAVGLLMAIWWMTEALPIPATALLPIVLFPVLSVASVQESATPYAHPLIFLFMGGFLIGLAMQRWQLHRRIALRIILRTGTRPLAIIGGFMIAAAALSMWISNTATALMMLPMGLSVIELVETSGSGDRKNFGVALLLGIAYACTVGGIGTLIGTPPNAFLAAFMSEAYGYDISFAGWMLIGVPIAIVSLPLVFFLVSRVIYRVRTDASGLDRSTFQDAVDELGPMGRGEASVAVIFCLTALLWMFRLLLQDVIPGLSDTGIALFGALLLFIVPVDLKRGLFLMNWEWARRLPWGTLLLFGGGLSLAWAINDSGLATWIGSSVAGIGDISRITLIVLVVAVIVMLTELTSNTATAAAFLPILAPVAIVMGENPLLVVVPAALAASCAFMLPVATPPNAIVYGSRKISIPQMAKAGIVLNLVFIVLISAGAYFLIQWVLGVEPGVLPGWATR